jgi:hypothetical protein
LHRRIRCGVALLDICAQESCVSSVSKVKAASSPNAFGARSHLALLKS